MKKNSLKCRVERDSMGERMVPEEAWYGAQTSRSMENFPFGGEDRLPMEVVRGMALVKAAAADANLAEGRLAKDKAEAIAWACGEVMSGRMDGEFALPVYQAGSGTSSHMNLNEVVANLANVRLGGRKGYLESFSLTELAHPPKYSSEPCPVRMILSPACLHTVNSCSS